MKVKESQWEKPLVLQRKTFRVCLVGGRKWWIGNNGEKIRDKNEFMCCLVKKGGKKIFG